MDNDKRIVTHQQEINQLLTLPKWNAEKECLTGIRFGKGYVMLTFEGYIPPSKEDLKKKVIFK